MDMISSAATSAGQALGFVKAQKASLICKGDVLPANSLPIDCMFNPTEYSLKQSVTVERAAAPSVPGGNAEYRGTNAMVFSAKLFFDAFDQYNGDVTPTIGRLLEWTLPIPDLQEENKACPPLVGFEWGNNPQLKKFRGFLTNVTVTYQLFRHDGTPVRAEVDITIEGESLAYGKPPPTPDTGQNPTSRAIGSSKVHRLVEGESIQAVAYKRLGKPTYWRAIAELNDIDDPFRVEAGTILLIPTAAEAADRS